jgi:hypothetical protein
VKKILLLLLTVFSLISCTTNYYAVLLAEDTNLYGNGNSEIVITTIPKNTQVFLSAKPNKKNYKKIKWGSYFGWANNPNYTKYNAYTPANNYKSSPNLNSSSSYRPSSSSGGTVKVKGYTRKDGTYVRPHTRSAPRRK